MHCMDLDTPQVRVDNLAIIISTATCPNCHTSAVKGPEAMVEHLATSFPESALEMEITLICMFPLACRRIAGSLP